MKDTLDKISSYNLFNILLPGVLFVTFSSIMTRYSFFQENLVVGAFVAYFIGLVINRIGSLFLEPFLKKLSFLKFSNYASYISASKKNPKIELLSETNNMYRTFITMLVLIFLLKIVDIIEFKFPALGAWNFYALIILLLIIFLYSYKKQTEYIVNRVMSKSD